MNPAKWCVLAALAAALLPLAAWGAYPPNPPSPPQRAEVMLQRLDVNRDGAITADELPPGAAERLKQWLKQADKNNDQKVTLDELRQAAAQLPPGPPDWARGPAAGGWGGPGAAFGPGRPGAAPGRGPQAGPGPGAPGKPSAPAARSGRGMGGPGGPPAGADAAPPPGQRGQRGPAAQRPPQPEPPRPAQPPAPPAAPGRGPAAGRQPGAANLKAIFDRLDRDKDGKLDFAELSAGIGALRGVLSARLEPWARLPQAVMGRAGRGFGPGLGPAACPFCIARRLGFQTCPLCARLGMGLGYGPRAGMGAGFGPARGPGYGPGLGFGPGAGMGAGFGRGPGGVGVHARAYPLMRHWLDAGRQGWRSFQQRGLRGLWQQMPVPPKMPQWFDMPKRMMGQKLQPFGPLPKGPAPELTKGSKAGPPPHVQPPAKAKPIKGEPKAPKEIKTPKGPPPKPDVKAPKPDPKAPKPELKGPPPLDKAPRPEAKGPKKPAVKEANGPDAKAAKGPEVKGPKSFKPDEQRMADFEARLKALEIKLDRLLDQPPGPPVDRRGPDGRGPARGGPPGRR